MTPNFLTVAIPYVNAKPHLGYAYELVLADIHAQAGRLDGVDYAARGRLVVTGDACRSAA